MWALIRDFSILSQKLQVIFSEEGIKKARDTDFQFEESVDSKFKSELVIKRMPNSIIGVLRCYLYKGSLYYEREERSIINSLGVITRVITTTEIPEEVKREGLPIKVIREKQTMFVTIYTKDLGKFHEMIKEEGYDNQKTINE